MAAAIEMIAVMALTMPIAGARSHAIVLLSRLDGLDPSVG
jgi:hypothetical protein